MPRLHPSTLGRRPCLPTTTVVGTRTRRPPTLPHALSRRDALAAAFAAATPCLCATCALRTPAGRSAYQKYFAASMAGPIMQQYERDTAAAKASLFDRARTLATDTRRRLDVLDVGVGAGPNARFFGGADVASYVGLDPNPAMASFAAASADAAGWGPSVSFVQGGAEDAMTAVTTYDGRVDLVIMTLVLCSVPNVETALAAAATVLRPGGVLAFHEHVAADAATRPLLAFGQRALAPLQRALADGCHLTRDPEPVARAVDRLRVVECRSFDVEGAGLIAPHKQCVCVRV